MIQRLLPGTDLSLSVVGFGAWAIGGRHWGDDVDDADSQAAIHAALDEGINWIDTAPAYGDGHSERLIRRALGERSRDDVLVATKVGVVYGEDGHLHSHLTPENIERDLDQTLQRLGADHLDLLQVHWPCELGTPIEETFTTLARLQQAGRFRHLGVCNYGVEDLKRIQEVTPIVSVQDGLSMLRRTADRTSLPWCRQHRVGFLAYEPLCRGLLTGKFTHLPDFPETDLRRFDDRFKAHRFEHARRLNVDLAQVARKVGVPPAAIAIGWVATRPGVSSVIVGAKRPEQIRQSATVARVLDRPKLWEVVDRISTLHGGTPP